MSGVEKLTKRQIAQRIYANGMRCNCDLDNWEPEASTGHSHVCRIHKAVMKAASDALLAKLSDGKAVQS